MGLPALEPRSAAATAKGNGSPAWRQLGQIVLDHGRINAAQLRQALDAQQQLGLLLGDALVRLGYLDAISLCEALVQQAGLPTANLDEQTPDEQTLRHVPSQFAFQ